MTDAPFRFSPAREVTCDEMHAQMTSAPSTAMFAFYWCDAASLEAEQDDPSETTLIDVSMPRVGLLAIDPIVVFDLARLRAIEEAKEAIDDQARARWVENDDEDESMSEREREDKAAREAVAIVDASQWRFTVENEHDARITRWTALLEHPEHGALCAVSVRLLEPVA